MTTTYDRRGTRPTQPDAARGNPMPAQDGGQATDPSAKDEQIRVDGYQQVLAMLKIADDEFRASLLKRLNARDPQLAARIMRELRMAGVR